MRSKLHFLSLTTIGPSPVNVFNTKEVPSWFSDMWFPKLLLPRQLIRILASKRPDLVQNMHFWSFAKYWWFWSIWCYAQPNNVNEEPRWFSDMWVARTFAPSKNNKNVWPKTAKFCPKYAFLGTYRPCRLIWWPVGWLVGGCGAQAVSRKTPIYFLIINLK